MLQISTSGATKTEENKRFVELKPERGGNLEWVEQALGNDAMRGEGDTLLLLLGARDLYGFRLRVAQAHARSDLLSSDWSHVALFQEPRGEPADAELVEVSLSPPRGFGWPVPTNGVRRTPLKTYRSSRAFPNIALARVPLEWEAVTERLRLFQQERRTLDVNQAVLIWLGFVWGAGGSGNPLLQGIGVPAAAMVEAVVGAAGYELTPGIESAASCPEAIWQTCRWWHRYYDDAGDRPAPRGCWRRRESIEQKLGFAQR